MKREIKFRAWNKELKIMVCGDEDGSSVYWDGVNESKIDMINYCLRDEDYEWMQFTGLLDTNEKEIYEDDVLKQSPGFGCAWEERTGTVKYEGASFWFNAGAQEFILDDHDCQFEVIGNIYETVTA